MTGLLVGPLLGLVAGSGLLLVMVGIPWGRRPDLDARLAPYLRDAPRPSRLLLSIRPARTPFPTLERVLAPVMADAVRWVERVMGGAASVRRRLDQLGTGGSLEAFRAEQVVWGVVGLGTGLGTALGVAAARDADLVPLVAMVVLGGVGGVVARDAWLTRQVSQREDRMLVEFPTVAELLALSVGAGEGAVGALERVARTCRGELSDELRRTLADARAGASLVQALEGLARRTNVPSLERFVDGVAVAVERGTPLAEVLRAQAQDVRELGRRRLIESGGKKEIAMMVPVVFLVLPVTILFAVFPGLAVLELQL